MATTTTDKSTTATDKPTNKPTTAQEVKRIAKPFPKDASYRSTILLLGDTGAGKSTWLTRISTGRFEEKHTDHKDLNVCINKQKFTNGVENKWHSFQIIEVPAHMKNENLSELLKDEEYIHDEYLHNISAIIMVDSTKRKTHENILSWIDKIKDELGDVPTVLAYNKCDEIHQKISNRHLRSLKEKMKQCACTSVSAKSCYNFAHPMLYIVRYIYNNTDLTFGII